MRRCPGRRSCLKSLKPFARCNAVRLTHERFRADTQGLIKALEQVLTEAEAARKAEGDAARREVKSKEKAEAERLRQERREQSRKRGEEKTDKTSLGETIPQARSRGVVSLIAGLPSNADWAHPDCGDRLTSVGMDLARVCFHVSGAGRLRVGDGRAALRPCGFRRHRRRLLTCSASPMRSMGLHVSRRRKRGHAPAHYIENPIDKRVPAS